MAEEQKDRAKEIARDYFREAYEYQVRGEFKRALALYERSIEIFPTAEAYTFLGWTYSFMGRYDDAIRECEKAIAVDPDFGNPYNDIGAYLIEKGQLDEAVPWLLKATSAKRYDCHCYPHFNLGRVWELKGNWEKALRCYEEALRANPEYKLAQKSIFKIRSFMN